MARVGAVPELKLAGALTARSAEALPLLPHYHDSLEITYLKSGAVTFWAGEERHEVAPGQIYVTSPGEVHGVIGDHLPPCRMYWLQVDLGGDRSHPENRFLSLPEDEAAGLTEALGALGNRRCFLAERDLTSLFRRLLTAISDYCAWDETSADAPTGARAAMGATAVRSALLDILLSTVASAALPSSRWSGRLSADAIRLMAANLRSPLSLAEIAERLNYSVSYFQARFRSETGTAPGEHYMHLRMAEACRLLEQTGQPVGYVAQEVGFASSQSFANTFRRLVGTTPRAYRRTVLAGGRKRAAELAKEPTGSTIWRLRAPVPLPDPN